MNTDRKNLIFIMTDHQRADSINMIQDGKEVTPNLNILARQSTVFSRAYTTCPLCVPARTALATGKNPILNGIVYNDINGSRARNNRTIHEYLSKAGYEVAHIGIDHIRVKPELKKRTNFAQWISDEEYEYYAKEMGISTKRVEADSTEVEELHQGKYIKHKYSNTRSTVWAYKEEDFKDNFFTSKSIDFISCHHDNPFALFLYLWAPHPPLIVPEPYASKFNVENLIIPDNVGVSAIGEPESRRKGVAAQLAEGILSDEWKKVWSAHLGLVNLADAAIGRIIEALQYHGYMDNSVIVFTSDHGDHLGQHNMYQKMEVYEQAINVPAIIRVPGAKGKINNTPISHLDFLPTILDILDIHTDDKFEGRSLMENICGIKSLDERDIFCVYCGNPTIGDIRRAVISGKYKYIYDTISAPELYDLSEDPLETVNLALIKDYEKVIKEMHNKCKEWSELNGDWILY